jgi:hypothetical protein
VSAAFQTPRRAHPSGCDGACTAIVGSIRSLCRARSRASVRSSSAPTSRLLPTTSAVRIAPNLRGPCSDATSALGPMTNSHSTTRRSCSFHRPERSQVAASQITGFVGDLARHHRSQERQGRAAASAKARPAAREPDEPAIPIGRRVWPPHRNLPADRIHRARTD